MNYLHRRRLYSPRLYKAAFDNIKYGGGAISSVVRALASHARSHPDEVGIPPTISRNFIDAAGLSYHIKNSIVAMLLFIVVISATQLTCRFLLKHSFVL